jgi:hypothetical protein
MVPSIPPIYKKTNTESQVLWNSRMLFYIIQEVAVHHKIENNSHSIVFFPEEFAICFNKKRDFCVKINSSSLY